MDKLKMAHEWAMVCLKSGLTASMEELIIEAWKYADAMQAEADKRNNSQPVITDQDKQRIEQAYSNIVKPPIVGEWQPDWSQAPDGAMQWRMFGDGSCIYYDINGCVLGEAPSFNYQGNWQDSLRKRPTNI